MRVEKVALTVLLAVSAHAFAAGSAPSPSPAAPTDPLGQARTVLAEYDAAVRAYKLANGYNVTLQLEDPCPPVIATGRWKPLETAAGWLQELLAREPAHRTARLTLAQLARRHGENREAVATLEAHTAQHPGDAAGWNALGAAYSRVPGWDARKRKLACYRRAVELDPRNASSWANLGNALVAAGRSTEAVAAGLKAIALKPDYVYAWMNLGIAYGSDNDHAREMAAYVRAIHAPAGSEQCPYARFNLALCFEQKKAYPEAVRWYRDALAVGLPDGPRSLRAALFHHNLARALYHAGEYAEATREANAALAIAPKLPEPYSLLGHLFAKAGQAEPARKAFQKATQLLAVHGTSSPNLSQSHPE